MPGWPASEAELAAAQLELAAAREDLWPLPAGGSAAALALGGCFVCFERGQTGPGEQDDAGFAAAAVVRAGRLVGGGAVACRAGAPYAPGLLALRQGRALEAAVRALRAPPDVLLVDATGRDHPRRAGLARQLGAILDLPTAGVTDRPLLATGPEPGPARGDVAPLLLAGQLVGYRLRARVGTRPLCVHAAWRTDPDTAVAIVLAATGGARTPEPLRQARRLAREARAAAVAEPGRGSGGRGGGAGR